MLSQSASVVDVVQQVLMQASQQSVTADKHSGRKHGRACAHISVILTADLAQLIHQLPPLLRPSTCTHTVT